MNSGSMETGICQSVDCNGTTPDDRALPGFTLTQNFIALRVTILGQMHSFLISSMRGLASGVGGGRFDMLQTSDLLYNV